jgi:HD-GYP domain-containing protein (c-di-GMP phosphodiesterase class II)
VITELPSRAEAPDDALSDQARALAVVLEDEFGVPFAFFDAATGQALGAEASSLATPLPGGMVREVARVGQPLVRRLGEESYRVVLLLYQAERPAFVAAGTLPGLCLGTDDEERERERLEKWVRAVSNRLRLTDQLFERQRAEDVPVLAASHASASIAWEALLTVDHVVRRMRVHKDSARIQQRVVEAAFELAGARTLVWVPPAADVPAVVLGEPALASVDARHLASCLAKQAEVRPPEPVLCNDVADTTWGMRFSRVRNLLAFPVVDVGPFGWVIAINKREARRPERERQSDAPEDRLAPSVPFRRSDAALLTPFVALLELHVRATRRYQDLKELLVGLTRSLTAALDAKDSYTYGHSERVARIAVELGRELGLGPDDLSDIYLAGLLHDVGKIGIKDAVLTKPGPLTREEFEHIKQHVTIGYTILADLTAIRNLLPGVLWHHERWDGKGYPDGLAGDSIPLLARILAVADSYDAMSTARPYREAMPCRRVEEILQQGAGAQWDARIIEAFLRCRQKIHAIRQRGVGESLCAAIDGALRSQDASGSWPAPVPAQSTEG